MNDNRLGVLKVRKGQESVHHVIAGNATVITGNVRNSEKN